MFIRTALRALPRNACGFSRTRLTTREDISPELFLEGSDTSYAQHLEMASAATLAPLSSLFAPFPSLITSPPAEKEVTAHGHCQHGRRRSTCKECGGSAICTHGRQRSRCKDCNGGGICQHGRRRSECKDCGGGSMCEHGRRRRQCKACGGKGICEHGRVKSKCRDCGGGSICPHKRERSKCKDCGGGGICDHGRVRSKCKECSGSSTCEHQRRRSECAECLVNKLANDKRAASPSTSSSSTIAAYGSSAWDGQTSTDDLPTIVSDPALVVSSSVAFEQAAPVAVEVPYYASPPTTPPGADLLLNLYEVALAQEQGFLYKRQRL